MALCIPDKHWLTTSMCAAKQQPPRDDLLALLESAFNSALAPNNGKVVFGIAYNSPSAPIVVRPTTLKPGKATSWQRLHRPITIRPTRHVDVFLAPVGQLLSGQAGLHPPGYCQAKNQ